MPAAQVERAGGGKKLGGCSFAPLGLVCFPTLPTACEVAEKVVQDEKSAPQALKRLRIVSDLAARLKSGPSQNLRESEFFRRRLRRGLHCSPLRG